MANPTQFPNPWHTAYRWGFFFILFLPFLFLPFSGLADWSAPLDWLKTIFFRSAMAIMLFFLAYQVLAKGQKITVPDARNSKSAWFLGLLFVAAVLATVFSQDPGFSLWGSPQRSGGTVNFMFYLAFCFLGFILLKKEDWERLIPFSLGTGALVCLVAVIQFYGLLSNILIAMPDRPSATMGNPILLGIYLALLFFLALPRFLQANTRNKKILYGGAMALFGFVILITGSRSAYIGMAAGLLYFALLYPQKMRLMKIGAGALLLLMVASVYAVNAGLIPEFIAQNRVAQQIIPRLSFNLLDDPRFSAWSLGWQAFLEKPILGWGPENFSIGFDKHYDPSLPYISREWGGWWDKAHNIFLDLLVTGGIVLLVAYVAFFAHLFWNLQKIKGLPSTNALAVHGLQAMFIAYAGANFFFFDSFSTYIMLFFAAAYGMHLVAEARQAEPVTLALPVRMGWAKPAVGALGVLLLLFLWQYNFVPLRGNAQVNEAGDLASQQKCRESLNLMDEVMAQKGILVGYAGTAYVDRIRRCATLFPDRQVEYAERGTEVIAQALKARPHYPRLWLFLGSFSVVQAHNEQDPIKKEQLFTQAENAFAKAAELAPNHQEIIIEQAKADMARGDYAAMLGKAESCASKEEDLGECYWLGAWANALAENFSGADEQISVAESKRFDSSSIFIVQQLANVYAEQERYAGLVILYGRLIWAQPDVAQYHASLAFAHYHLGEWEKARESAIMFLKMMPSAKDEVEYFMSLLPPKPKNN